MEGPNVAETICGEWLKGVKSCSFVLYNTKTLHQQGEIDVLGMDLTGKKIYACEVAAHLATGLQYGDNVSRFQKKFAVAREYLERFFPEYSATYMLWSPIVRAAGPAAKNNQAADVEAVASFMRDQGLPFVAMTNEAFASAIASLRELALSQSQELAGIMRVFQIEEWLADHLRRSRKKEHRMKSKEAAQAARNGLRLLTMVVRLHQLGYQFLRISPGLSPSGQHWRCSFAPASWLDINGWEPAESEDLMPRYSTADADLPFGWQDAAGDSPEELAGKFLERFPEVCARAVGKDPAYKEWLDAVTCAAQKGQLPILYADFDVESVTPKPPPLPTF